MKQRTPAQRQAERTYKKKLKRKIITFYLHEEDLANFADSINFQAFVKKELWKYYLASSEVKKMLKGSEE